MSNDYFEERRSRSLAAQAKAAADAERWLEAEGLYRQALAAAAEEKDEWEQHFMEGRLADVLLHQDKTAAAKETLERSLETSRNDVLPASAQMLTDIYIAERDWQAAERVLRRARVAEVERAAEHKLDPPETKWRMGRLAWAGLDARDATPIESAMRWAAELGDRELWFQVAHQLGALAEATGNEPGALAWYQELAKSGSQVETTHTRLLILLERRAQSQAALDHARALLTNQWTASFEEQLGKRIQRLSRRLAPKGAKPPKQVIAAFAVREGADVLQWIGQADLKGGVVGVWALEDELFAITGGATAALYRVDQRLAEAVLLRTVDRGAKLVFAPDGRATMLVTDLGLVRDGRARVEALDDGWQTRQSFELGGVTSQVASHHWGAAIGSRDGSLYAVDWKGRLTWQHSLPAEPGVDPYMRPCPYFVSASVDTGRTIFSSWSSVFCLESDGRLAWTWSVPEQRQEWRSVFRIGATADERAAAARLLGVSQDSGEREVRSAFRSKARETHPDVSNGEDRGFVALRDAYELLLGAEPKASEFQVVFTMSSSSLVAAVAGTSDGGAYVSASAGQVFRLDEAGRVLFSVPGADQSAELLVDRRDKVVAVSDNDGVTFLDDHGHPAAAYSANARMSLSLSPEEDLLVGHVRNELWLFNRTGRLLSRAEFSRSISSLAWAGDTLVVAAGKLVALRRR